ncbi:helix-turn-helix domain-containing protein [Sporosarcina sp. FSL W7-1283]|uniref:helix-turn-helix domain-containing protein n=1 Tax=Sporosarcina sp. FSL W7-1283 TaxID=2921560 RepID=UPI0030FCC93B
MVSIFSQEVQQEMRNEIVESVMKTLSVLIQENSKRYLRLAEASKYASISHNTLTKWIEVYKLPVCCIDGVRIIDTQDLDAMIAKYKI